MIRIYLPIKTVSLLNMREHFRVTAKRKKEHREIVALVMGNKPRPELPCRITLTRISAGELDSHDNLPSAFKHIVDGLADWLGIDDADPRVTWAYEQEKCKLKQFGVRVEIVGGVA